METTLLIQVSCTHATQIYVMLDNLKRRHHFYQTDDPIGNLILGRGYLWGASARLAIIENRIASGSLGVDECDALARLFTEIAATGESLILFFDCAGARVSEGLPALGAFRRMFAAALGVDGVRMVAYCGTNCFGGGSMLASLAGLRVLGTETRFAMSGPAIIAGDNPRDLANINTAISCAARLNPALRYDSALTQETHESPLHIRLSGCFSEAEMATARAFFPHQAALEIKLTDGTPMGAARAWALADWLWLRASTPPPSLRIFVDCPAHAASIQDERQYLSAQIVNLARALYALREAGTEIDTVVTGTLGGGVYVALAAASRVLLAPSAEIRLLPGKAMATILGENTEIKSALAVYLATGVADAQWEQE